jgi:hypothetical protein
MCTAVSSVQLYQVLEYASSPMKEGVTILEKEWLSKLPVFNCNSKRVKEIQRMLTTKSAPEFYDKGEV